MHKIIFREYDIRGKVGSELLIEHVYDLVSALAAYFLQKNPSLKQVVVGYDGRVHSLAIKKEVCRALQDGGIDVVCIGLCPTPVMYFATHTLSVDAGIMITASHNGPEYNGLKITFGCDSVWGSEIQIVRTLYEARMRPVALQKGTYADNPYIEPYIAWLGNHFSHLKGISTKIVFDCANGAAGVVIPRLIETMGWTSATVLYADVDGTFPHHEADPVVEKNAHALRHAVLEEKAEIGIGFDGDADRMAPLTAAGRLVGGDQLLVVYAQDILKQIPGATIIYDIKCSKIVSTLIDQTGGKAVMAPSGHSIIKTKLRTNKAVFAGELSCHFFFADRYFGYDDGIYAALRLIELLYYSKASLDSLVDSLPHTYITSELRIPCIDEMKPAVIAGIKDHFLQQQGNITLIDGLMIDKGYGWGLVRASNTQPVVCVRCESSTAEGLQRIKKDFYEALEPYINREALDAELGGMRI